MLAGEIVRSQGEVEVVAGGARRVVAGVETLPRVVDVDEGAHVAVLAGGQHLVAHHAVLHGAGRQRRFAEQRDLLRRVDHRQHVLAEHGVRGGGRVHAVGEQVGLIGAGRIAVRQARALRAALHRAGTDAAGRCGDIAEAVGARVGDHFVEQGIGVGRNHVQAIAAELFQAAVEYAVVEHGELAGAGLGRGTAESGLRGLAEIGQVVDQHVLRAGGLQAREYAEFGLRRVDCAGRDRVRIGQRAAQVEDVVGAAPDLVQGTGVGLAAIRAQVHLQLLGDGRHRRDVVDKAGAAPGVIRAAGCRRREREAEAGRHVLRGGGAGVGGEAQRRLDRRCAGQRDVAVVAQAVAEDDDIAEIGGRGGRAEQHGGRNGAGQMTGAKHGSTPGPGWPC